MKPALRIPLLTLGILAACAPVTFVITFLLFPFWSWIEARFGVEAVGHSGPAGWCFWTVYALLAATSLISYARLEVRHRKRT